MQVQVDARIEEAAERETSDRDLERRVSDYLADRHWPGLRRLQVAAQNGTVTLRGTVSSFYEKQLSHQCCRHVAGVRKLIDAVAVTQRYAAALN